MSYPSYPRSKGQKTWKKRNERRVIHVIHTKTYVFGGQLWIKNRTDVLGIINKNHILSKEIEKMIDF